jgi:DNA-binding transcriptional MerR regulator/methylmalonyl-CoA mutase cobalamin-binding subunit
MIETQYPLAMVARITGLSPQLIRAWESRHDAIQPRRSTNGRRIYSQEHITRLHRLRSLTAAGFPISRIAHLALIELEELAAREVPKALPVARQADGTAMRENAAEAFVAETMNAIGELDGDSLIAALESADVELGKPAFLESVVAVVAERVGEAWRNGRLKVAHEHFATAQLRGYLGPFGRVPHLNAATPHLIVTTPPEQWHELGALLAAAAAHSHGWRVTYMGPSLPAEEIAGAAHGYRARAVALSIVFPEDDPQLPRELSRLRRLLPKSTALLIGGRGSHGLAPLLGELGARHLTSLRELYPVLDELRSAPASSAEAQTPPD